jgi:5S rRNA maturation endonuclease (ribonuclease M5)
MKPLNLEIEETYTINFRCENNIDANNLAMELESKVENYNNIKVSNEVVILFTDIDEMGETFPKTEHHEELTIKEPQYYFNQTLEVAKNSGININFIQKIIC